MAGRLVIALTFMACTSVAWAAAPRSVIKDPILAGRAWGMSETSLSYNERYNKKGKWEVRFDKGTFLSITGSASAMQIKRVVPSTSEQGKASLVVAGVGGTYVFETTDFGSNWWVVKSPSGDRPVSAQGEAVDLNALNTAPSVTNPHSATSATAGPGAVPAPSFKILFDLLLHLRPGVSPWTFDNYHGLLLVDFIPKPDIQFSFEVSPSPRYYEFDYQMTKSLQLRVGRIWIPFDDLNPHNTFGGLMNTSKMRDPRAAAFLPDIWTDLGVGLKWKLADSHSLQSAIHFYLVNGFQGGGTDPTGQVTVYPNFAGSSGIDNNTDKAMGLRFNVLLNQLFGFGASFYTARYTDQAEEAKRMSLFGMDGSVRLVTGTTLKAGYTYQKVELATGAAKSDFLRGGAYVEGSQRLNKNYIFGGRFGVQQGDDRVTDLNDQTWATGRVGYETDIWQFYIIYAKDLNDVPEKSSKEYTAGRFVVTL